MHAIHESLLRGQIAHDTLWCWPCGVSDIRRRADVKYTVSSDHLSASVLACRDCFNRELRQVPIVACEPVTQPAYITLLEAALA